MIINTLKIMKTMIHRKSNKVTAFEYEESVHNVLAKFSLAEEGLKESLPSLPEFFDDERNNVLGPRPSGRSQVPDLPPLPSLLPTMTQLKLDDINFEEILLKRVSSLGIQITSVSEMRISHNQHEIYVSLIVNNNKQQKNLFYALKRFKKDYKKLVYLSFKSSVENPRHIIGKVIFYSYEEESNQEVHHELDYHA